MTTPARILVIDDEPLITQMLHRMLRRRFTVTTAGDGASALAHFQAGESFDLIVCDLMMNPLSGADVFARLETIAPAMQERFVLMTGGASLKHVEEFLERWPHPVLLKPFAVVDVEQLIDATLERAATLPRTQVG